MTGIITWHQGDCRDILPGLAADLILTDPPYGSTPQPWDRWPEGWVKLAAGCAPSLWCFGSARVFLEHGHEFADAGWRFAEDIVWEKHNGSGPGSRRRFQVVHEMAYHWYQGRWGDVYAQVPRVPREGPERAPARRVPANTRHKGSYGASSTWTDDGMRLMRSVIWARSLHRLGTHTAQKPDEVLRALVEASCPPGGTVLDPFAGSGSVLRVAAALGRNAIGIDLTLSVRLP
jgi:site-specific DNA-methyltransferase (adenine-specific)